MLLSFRGALYDFPPSHFAHVRRHLPALHNGRDVVVSVTCFQVAPSCACPEDKPACSLVNVTSSRDPRCGQWHAQGASVDYDELLTSSK